MQWYDQSSKRVAAVMPVLEACAAIISWSLLAICVVRESRFVEGRSWQAVRPRSSNLKKKAEGRVKPLRESEAGEGGERGGGAAGSVTVGTGGRGLEGGRGPGEVEAEGGAPRSRASYAWRSGLGCGGILAVGPGTGLIAVRTVRGLCLVEVVLVAEW